MSLLAIDIETFSDVDLPKCGVYAYSDSPRFEILLFAYAFDDEPTQVVDLARGEQLPNRVLSALEDETVIKTAFNAAFERTCISRYLGRQLSPASWQCTAVQSAIVASSSLSAMTSKKPTISISTSGSSLLGSLIPVILSPIFNPFRSAFSLLMIRPFFTFSVICEPSTSSNLPDEKS